MRCQQKIILLHAVHGSKYPTDNRLDRKAKAYAGNCIFGCGLHGALTNKRKSMTNKV